MKPLDFVKTWPPGLMSTQNICFYGQTNKINIIRICVLYNRIQIMTAFQAFHYHPLSCQYTIFYLITTLLALVIDAYVIELFSNFLFKRICCWYPFNCINVAIQMSTNIIYLLLYDGIYCWYSFELLCGGNSDEY